MNTKNKKLLLGLGMATASLVATTAFVVSCSSKDSGTQNDANIKIQAKSITDDEFRASLNKASLDTKLTAINKNQATATRALEIAHFFEVKPTDKSKAIPTEVFKALMDGGWNLDYITINGTLVPKGVPIVVKIEDSIVLGLINESNQKVSSSFSVLEESTITKITTQQSSATWPTQIELDKLKTNGYLLGDSAQQLILQKMFTISGGDSMWASIQSIEVTEAEEKTKKIVTLTLHDGYTQKSVSSIAFVPQG